MRILTGKNEIKNAQNQVIKLLTSHCTDNIPVKLGHQGETIECSINWSPTDGLWVHSRTFPNSRYWNAFGIKETRPKNDSLLPIIVEINPPIEGLNRLTQGAFIEKGDESIILVYRGKIGGGRKGIGRQLFFDNYRGRVQKIFGKQFAVLGEIRNPDLVQKILYLVQEVDRIKHLI